MSKSQILRALQSAYNQSADRVKLASEMATAFGGSVTDMLTIVKLVERLIKIQKGDQGDRGEKGDPGHTPVKGKDYFTDAEIEQFIRESTPEKGKDYFTAADIREFLKIATPVKGKDYRDGKDGKDGQDGIANMAEVNAAISDEIKLHAKEHDHAKIHDPKILGELELGKYKEGDVLQVRGGKLVGVRLPKTEVQPFMRGGGGNTHVRSFSITSSQSVDAMGVYVIDATSGDITVTLPTASGSEGVWFEFVRIDGSANTVTVQPTGSETLSGESSYLLQRWTDLRIFAYTGNYLIRSAS